MREFDVLDVIRGGLKSYAGATAVFQEDKRRRDWVDQATPFVTFNVLLAEKPDPRQSGALRPTRWRNIPALEGSEFDTDVELMYQHQPHAFLSINCYAGMPTASVADWETIEGFTQLVRDWFNAAGRLALDEINVRTYEVSPVRNPEDFFHTPSDMLARRQMDVELVVAKGIFVRVNSLEKVVLNGHMTEEGSVTPGSAYDGGVLVESTTRLLVADRLVDLSDVDVEELKNSDRLVYDEASGKWKNKPDIDGGPWE